MGEVERPDTDDVDEGKEEASKSEVYSELEKLPVLKFDPFRGFRTKDSAERYHPYRCGGAGWGHGCLCEDCTERMETMVDAERELRREGKLFFHDNKKKPRL